METGHRIAFHTLGCKLNQAETELLARKFTEAGYRVIDSDGADVCVLNTCTVTHIADRKSRHLLRLLRKRNPVALIIALGCYAERAPYELAQVGADLIVDNKHKMHLLEIVEEKLVSKPCSSTGQLLLGGRNRVRSFVKIQDGCSDFCAYCIVPHVRNREYCLPVKEIVDEVNSRVSVEYREIVLTGTKIGTYNYDGAGLEYLIQQILAGTDVQRLHLSSLQPQDISSELLSLWRNPRLCRHFHLALQSGSETVLKRMKRNYSIAGYRKAVSLIRRAVPDAAVTTDIIVGFPGESDGEFEESYRFCREIDFADIHIFPYSSRPGTRAAKMPEKVKESVKKERSLKMQKLAQESAQKFREQFLGQTIRVLWEHETVPGSRIYSGFSDNYVRVFTESRKPLTNQLLSVHIVTLYDQGLWGEVIE